MVHLTLIQQCCQLYCNMFLKKRIHNHTLGKKVSQPCVPPSMVSLAGNKVSQQLLERPPVPEPEPVLGTSQWPAGTSFATSQELIIKFAGIFQASSSTVIIKN